MCATPEWLQGLGSPLQIELICRAASEFEFCEAFCGVMCGVFTGCFFAESAGSCSQKKNWLVAVA